MQYSPEARKALTEACEGCDLAAYPDPGTGGSPWTIAYGHIGGVHPGDTCTQEQADAWLEEDMATAAGEVNRLLDTYLATPVTQHQFDALVDFQFNTGALASSTLFKKLVVGDLAGADQEFQRWVFGGGHRLPGLVKRRELESAWFDTKDN